MPKPFPRRVSLKQKRCPDCKKSFREAELSLVEQAVAARCPTSACEHRLEVFWLGDHKVRDFELN
jgi:uncharacterized protein with PIN domain